MTLATLNAFLDSLPRTRLGRAHRAAPAFRTCGITGFYVALVTLFGAGLVTGRALTVLALIALVSGLSFFVYTYLRKWITGHEELVLLEHVWFAFACNAGTLAALGLPVLAYLDLVAVALCPFLAAGRVGCTLVGCCHGLPSSVGIRYPEECVADGFPRRWAGVRLFPAPALEGLGLTLIGVVGFLALPFALPGRVLTWFLLAYAILRFGLEGIRGDARPHWLGLSQARWMALVEVGVALALGPQVTPPFLTAMILVALLITLVACLVYQRRHDPRPRVLAPAHRQEAQKAIQTLIHDASGAPVPAFAPPRPTSTTTSAGVTLAVSRIPGAPSDSLHVSLALPESLGDLPLLCDLTAQAVPHLDPDSVRLTAGRILHGWISTTSTRREPRLGAESLAAALYRRILVPPSDPPYEPRSEALDPASSRAETGPQVRSFPGQDQGQTSPSRVVSPWFLAVHSIQTKSGAPDRLSTLSPPTP